MLPSPSPQFTATEMWGPIIAWCVLQLLAESVDAKQPERAALDLFDRLRLREPLGHAFGALGFKGEEAWRTAARIKILLLSAAADNATKTSVESASAAKSPAEEVRSVSAHDGAPFASHATTPATQPGASVSGEFAPDRAPVEPPVSQPAPQAPLPRDQRLALAADLWLDPDVRWLCGIHEAEGHVYMIRERYEELLWWLLLPSLLRLAGERVPSRAAAQDLGKSIESALESAKAAGYRVDVLLKPDAAAETVESTASEKEPASLPPSTPKAEI
jgi:hypothetical protein